MSVLVAFVLGGGIGLGVLLVVCGVTGRPVFAPRRRSEPRGVTSSFVLAVAVAVAVGLAVYAVTGWPTAGLLGAVAAGLGPRLTSGRSDHQREIARVEAIAGWAEMLRDTMAAAAGLEQAIVATAAVAPAPIAGPVGRLAVAIELEPLPVALRRFAEDVAHPTCDFVVAALTIAAEKEARDLGPLLGQLAVCARDEAKMRTRIWIDRARTRTSVRVIASCVVVFAAGLALLSPAYLKPYGSAGGQLMLLVIGGVFAMSFAAMSRMGRIAMPERFMARRTT